MIPSENPAGARRAWPHGHRPGGREDEIYWRGVCEERSRIAGELHDGLFCHLHAAALRLRNTAEALRREPSPDSGFVEGLWGDVQAAESLLQRAAAEVRGWLRDQPSASAAAETLPDALRRIAQEAQGTPTVADGGRGACGVCMVLDQTIPLLPTRTRWELVRIVQEALRNAIRHGCARSVEVRLDHLSPRNLVRLLVKDDGCGFNLTDLNPASETIQFGLRAMRSRAERLGGWLVVESQPGAGTSVTAAVPVTHLSLRPDSAHWPIVHHPALDH